MAYAVQGCSWHLLGRQSLCVCTACVGSAPLPSEVQGGRFVGQKVVPNLEGGRRLSDAEFLAFLEVSNGRTHVPGGHLAELQPCT